MTTSLSLGSPVTWRGVIQRASTTVLEQLLAQEQECRKENPQYIRPALHVPWDSIPADIQSDASNLLGLGDPCLWFIKLTALQYSLLCLHSAKAGDERVLRARTKIFEIILEATDIDDDHLGRNSSSLHFAAFLGLREAYAALVRYGASPAHRNSLGYSSEEILCWAIDTFPEHPSSHRTATSISSSFLGETSSPDTTPKGHSGAPALQNLHSMLCPLPSSGQEPSSSLQRRTRRRSSAILLNMIDNMPTTPDLTFMVEPRRSVVSAPSPTCLSECTMSPITSPLPTPSTERRSATHSHTTKPSTSEVSHTVEVVKNNEYRKGYGRPATPFVDTDATSRGDVGGVSLDKPCRNIQHEEVHPPSNATQLTITSSEDDGGNGYSGSSQSSPRDTSSSSSLSTNDSSDELTNEMGYRDLSPPGNLLTPNSSLSSMSSAGSETNRKSAGCRHRHHILSSSSAPLPIKPALKSPTLSRSQTPHTSTVDASLQPPMSPKAVSWAEMLNVCVFQSHEDGQDETWHVREEELPSANPLHTEDDDDDESVNSWNGNATLQSLQNFNQPSKFSVALRYNRSHSDVRNLFIEDQCVADPITVEDSIFDMEVQLVNANAFANTSTSTKTTVQPPQARDVPYLDTSLQVDGFLMPQKLDMPLPPKPAVTNAFRPLPTPPPPRPVSTPTPSVSSRHSSKRRSVARVSVKSPEVYQRLTNARRMTSESAMVASLAAPSKISPSRTNEVVSVGQVPLQAMATTSNLSILSPTCTRSSVTSASSSAVPPASWFSKIFRSTTPSGSISRAFRAHPPNNQSTTSLQSTLHDRPKPAQLDFSAKSSNNAGRQKSVKSPTFSQLLSPTANAKFSQIKSVISGGFSNTLRSPLFSPKSADPTSFAAMSANLSKAKDAETMPQLPPRHNDGPCSIPSRPLPATPSINSAKRQYTRSPQLYPEDASTGPLSLTRAASLVAECPRTDSRCQSQLSNHNDYEIKNERRVSALAAQPVCSPLSHQPNQDLLKRVASNLSNATTTHRAGITQDDTCKVDVPLSPEKRRLLSQTISGRAPEAAVPLQEHEHIVRAATLAVSGRDRSSTSVKTNDPCKTPAATTRVPSREKMVSSSRGGYDHNALERIIPDRSTVQSWRYLHSASHQPQKYVVKEQATVIQLSDRHERRAQQHDATIGWKTAVSMPRSTLSLTKTEPNHATGVLFLRVVGIKEFLLSIPSTHTMISVRVDTGRERLDTDFVALSNAQMLLGQEFCVPVFDDTVLTLTVHLMQAPHLFDDNDTVSAENYRLLTNLMTSGTTTPTDTSPRSGSPASTITSASAPPTPCTFGTNDGTGSSSRLGRLLHRKLRLSKPSGKSKDKNNQIKNTNGMPTMSITDAGARIGGRGSPANSTDTSPSCEINPRDAATLALCGHALFDDELCIAKSAVRFRDLRQACENEVTVADFEAFNNWYSHLVDRRNKTSDDFNLLETDIGRGDQDNVCGGEDSDSQRDASLCDAKMVAKVSTKICFVPGIALEHEDALLDHRSEDMEEGDMTDPISREPYNLRECAQAERYFAWNRRHVCEGELFYMTEASRVWRREMFMLVGCKIWRRRDDGKYSSGGSNEHVAGSSNGNTTNRGREERGGMYLDLEDLDRVQTVKGTFSACPLYALTNRSKMIKEGVYDAHNIQDEVSAGSFLPLRNGFRLWFKTGYTQDFYADDDKDAEEWVALILEVCRGRPLKPTWL